MNKIVQKKISVFFLIGGLLASCVKKNETEIEEGCIGDNYSIQLNRIIDKLEITYPDVLTINKTFSYSFNEYNLLEEVYEYNFDIDKKEFFTYKCNNNLSEKKLHNSNPKTYKYDNENRLISYASTNAFNNDYKLFYNGNKITVKGNIEREENISLELDVNSSGLVTKISRKDNYSTFEYDVNGNLISAKDFTLSNMLIKEYEITYDKNPNPFYGQFKSNYISNFLYAFSKSALIGVDVFYRFNQFKFPYLKNNPILVRDKSCSPCYDKLLERVYVYDAQNFPIEIKESYVGAPSITYKLKYK